MAHAEYRPVFGAGLDGGLGLFLGQGQGFFAENMFPRRHGALDLLGVKRMRRGKDNGLHAGVLEGFRVAAVVRKAVSLGKFLSCWIGLRGANDLDVVRRLLQDGEHLPAPPAEANHRDFDGSGFIHFKISTCAGLDLDLGRRRTAFTLGRSSPMRIFCSGANSRESTRR